jgi:hypothetical protein
MTSPALPEVFPILIRLPDKKVRRISIRKAGKETCNHILPAFLPSLFIFWQAPG